MKEKTDRGVSALSERIEDLAKELNMAIRQACAWKLRVEIDIAYYRDSASISPEIGKKWPCPNVMVSVFQEV